MRPERCVLAAACLLAAALLPAAGYRRLAPPPAGMYHAAFPFFANSEDRVSAEKIAAFEALAGKRVAWAYFSDNWTAGIRFPLAAVLAIHEHGAVPFVRLMAWSRIEQGAPERTYTMQRIIDGAFDRELGEWADQAAALPFALLVEFGTEVNGEWFPWNGSYNGGGECGDYGDPGLADGPERFRDAYRHIVDLFRRHGARNVTWFFHVNSDSWPRAAWNRMAAYYPGDEYVDWIGVSVYGSQAPGDDWTGFVPALDAAYPELAAISAAKPLALLEFAVAEDPRRGDKGKWIASALQALRAGRYPRLRASCWWHEAWENDDGSVSDLRIDSSPGALAAYRAGVADPFFLDQARILALLPPANARRQHLENDLIFYREAVDRLTWETEPLASAPLSAFRVYRRPAGGENYARVAEVPAAARAYDARGLKPGESYEYAVTAIDEDGTESEPAACAD